MKARWMACQPKTRFREVKAFVWQPDTDISEVLGTTDMLVRDDLQPNSTRVSPYKGPGALLKTWRGLMAVFPGDVIFLRPDNTLDVAKPDEFFAVWDVMQP